MAAGEHPAETRLIRPLGLIGRYGRWSLIAGLVAGLTLPDLALALKPWLPHLIAALLFVSAYRIGPRATVGTGAEIRASLARVLSYQLAAPLVALAILSILGLAATPAGLVIVLVLAAPSVTGAPNFAIMMGRDPTRAMRLLLVGTALFPLTVIPVLWALPAIPTMGGVLTSAGRLLAVIALAVGIAFLLRRDRPLPDGNRAALDGVAALLLAVVVVGLMSAMGPALQDRPAALAGWLAFALALNFGLQLLANRSDPRPDAGAAIVAGNRNIALFLVALPPEVTDRLLLFIGCYQIPMYLTPMVMARLLRSGD
ncbi:MAG: hypothetical protein LJE62_09290 [Silicimonas sp.]|jgi:hypothetical protein|nr:hypothetical protein [Silicimonas sp.]